MSELRTALDDYLRVRRALGYKLIQTERQLGQFVAYCEQAGTSVVTTDVAVSWATQPIDVDASWWAQRLSKVRCFATWLQTLDPATEVPPTDILTGRPRRAEPYIYTETEIAAIMAAARALRPSLQQHTYETLVGLLVVSGLRVGEVIRLDRCDVCLDSGLMRVVKSKFTKSREIPLHPSAVDALYRYTEHRDQLCPVPNDEAFFLGMTGSRLDYSSVHKVFARLIRQAGLTARSDRCRPRLHDFRHSFAVHTLVDWHRTDADVQARLPLLSTWLGHVNPEATYWYLTAIPELLGHASRRLEDTFEGGR